MREAGQLAVLAGYMARRTLRSGSHALAAPMIAGLVAALFLPRGLEAGLGEDVARMVAPGLAGLAAALAGLPLALLTVLEASTGVYSHLLLSGVKAWRVAAARLVVNGAFTAGLSLIGLTVLTLLYGYPSLSEAIVAAPLLAAAAIGLSGAAIVVTYPFRSPQAASIAATAAIALAEYATPLYYPASALPGEALVLAMIVNPLAPAVEALRSGATPGLAAACLASSTTWTILALTLLARRIKDAI